MWRMRRLVVIAGTALIALFAAAGSASAAGFGYAFAGPPTVTGAGQWTASINAVASVDGAFTLDVVGASGTVVTGTDDPPVFDPPPVPTPPVFTPPVLAPTVVETAPVPTRAVTVAAVPAPVVLPLDVARARLLVYLNRQRVAAGVKLLHDSGKLDRSAQGYASHLAADGRFSHTDGSVLDARIAATGYRYHWIGENLGLGQHSPWNVVHAWMGSPEHRANMLDPRFTDAGVGMAMRPDGQLVWCLDLGWPR
jgi:uncharacterized protein YkwD